MGEQRGYRIRHDPSAVAAHPDSGWTPAVLTNLGLKTHIVPTRLR